MDFSEEWKALWPISSVFSAPLLISGGDDGGTSPSKSKAQVGPLIFNPSPKTLTILLSSPSLTPLLPTPFPALSLSRFLSTTPSASDPSSLLPSTSSSVAGYLGPQLPDSDSSAAFHHNCLQLLRCPGGTSVLVFFPTGDNFDRVGFIVLSVGDSRLSIGKGGVDGDGVFTAMYRLNNQILRLLVNPVANSCSESANSSASFTTTVGYLMACTMYAVHWFRVRIRGLGSDSERPLLDFLGSKLFKSCSVAHACWSPHLPEESIVLLDSGELFLFDLDSCSKNRSSNRKFSGKRLRVSWKDSTLEKGVWLSCEFSWHPRILIVAHSAAVFLVDLRHEGCNVSCLLKIDTLVMSASVPNDRFVSFSKAGSDGFYFVVASEHLLLLCDVRKPFMPLLKWAHDLASPLYIKVFSLSELRSHYRDDRFKWASELGYCIIMGSFRNCEFSLFCYGPPPRGTVASELPKFCKSFYAWELPSELSLSGRDCNCGSCLVKEEFSKDALPEWIDWQQKKEIVLGFGILNKDLHAKLFELDGFGGFTLIRLMSSGKLESQRYCAAWEFIKVLEESHKESPHRFGDLVLYAMGDEDYKSPKRFKYLKLDYLNGFMKGNLTKLLFSKIKPCKGPLEKGSFSVDFHQCICEKLNACGFSGLGSFPAASDVCKDIRLLTSIHEVALSRIWAGFPVDILQLAFSCYPELLDVLVDIKKVSLEFLDVPSQLQLPPFVFHTPSCRSSKWSQKMQPGNALVGPLLPTPVLLTLRNLRTGEEADGLSANSELSNQCNEVLQMVCEMAKSGSGYDVPNGHAVNLSDDRDPNFYDTQTRNLFSLHKPVAFSCSSTMDLMMENSISDNEKFTTFIFQTPVKEIVPEIRWETARPELFNSLSALELKFDDHKNGSSKNAINGESSAASVSGYNVEDQSSNPEEAVPDDG
ncbi:hypothetical protein U1Q18_035650 [Sarracenia purpurea var. burkii]